MLEFPLYLQKKTETETNISYPNETFKKLHNIWEFCI